MYHYQTTLSGGYCCISSMYTPSVQPVLMATSIERQPLLKSQFQIKNLYTVTCLLSEGGNKQVPP